MSHQESITVEIDGKHYVVPTKVQGKKLSTQEAVVKAREFHSLGRGFHTEAEAIAHSKRKSLMANEHDKRLGKISH